MRSYSPVHFRHLVERTLNGLGTLEDVCEERITVAEPEPFFHEPAIFLSNQLDHVRAFVPGTTKAQEDKRIKGGDGVHAATTAYRIAGVKLRDSAIYKKNWRTYFPPVAHNGAPSRITNGSYALASSYCGVQYFGHWLHDDIATYQLAADFATPLCTRTPPWPDKARYEQIFDLDWAEVDYANLDELFCFIDHAQNSHKTRRYKALRRRLRERCAATYGGHKVYLRRGDGGAIKRIISNEDELIADLKAEGFVILDLTKDSIDDIITGLLEARIVVSIEGSNCDHAVYTMRDNGGFIAICPPTMFNNFPKDWTAALGVKYGFVVGEADGEAFKVDPRSLLKTVEMVEAAL